MNKWYKSETNQAIAGVLGGFAEKQNWNVAAVRIVYSLLTAFTAFVPGIVFYIIMAIVLKPDPMRKVNYKEFLEKDRMNKRS